MADSAAARRRDEERPSAERTIARSAQLDTVIHERTRLAIVSALAANERLGFVELKTLLDVTDGNLSAHTRKLEDAGYVRSLKSFEGRVPRTEYELTDEGREVFERYVEHMEALIRIARGR